MKAKDREVAEGIQYHGEDEIVYYDLTVTNWGSSPSSPTVKAYRVDDGPVFEDVSSTVLAGSPSVLGDVITLPGIKALTRGERYRVEVKFVVGSSTLEAIIPIMAQK